jgi:hypothetical protein
MTSKTKAAAALRRHGAHLPASHVQIDGDCVALFCAALGSDVEIDADDLRAVAAAIAADCGGCPMTGNGSAWFVWFKQAPATLGQDWNDSASRWHY